MRRRTRTRSEAASWCRSRTASTWWSIRSTSPPPRCAGRSPSGASERRDDRAGARLGPAHRIRVRAHRRRAHAYLRRDGDRQFRPWRVPHALHVPLVLPSRRIGVGPDRGGARQRDRTLRAGRNRVLRAHPARAARAHAGASVRDLRARSVPAERSAVSLATRFPHARQYLGDGPHRARRRLRERPATRRGGRRGRHHRRPVVVALADGDRPRPPGHRRGPPGGFAHGDQSRSDVRPRLGAGGSLRGRRRSAALHLLLRVSTGGRGVRPHRLRGRRAGRLRLRRRRVRRRSPHRRGRVTRRRVHRPGREERLRVRHLPGRRAAPAARLVREAVKIGIAAAVVVAVLLYPLVLRGPYPQHLMILVLLNALLGTAWNILGGFAGQISLGQATFFGAGAYTSTLLFQHAGVSPWVGLVAGAALAAALALAIGYPCFRLSGHYFAIATIAIGEIAGIAVTNWEFAGGAVGLFLPVEGEGMAAFKFGDKLGYYYVVAAFLALSVALAAWLRRGRAGYYWRAIREDQAAARSVGVPALRYKQLAIAISAALTAMAGTFYAQYLLFIDPPSVLPLSLSIQICLVAVLGGAGTLVGPLLGAAVLVPLSAATSVALGGSGRSLDLVVYGALIMVIAVFEPSGLVGIARRLRGRISAQR